MIAIYMAIYTSHVWPFIIIMYIGEKGGPNNQWLLYTRLVV